MYIQTEGIILRQTKTVGGRRIITIFSKNYGKISCGTNITEGGKNKTALALRPFTHGRYELYTGRDTYNVQGAETVKSYYRIGENIDKYMAACFVLELTEKCLIEGDSQPYIFRLLSDFFELLVDRKTAFDTLVVGYQTKLLGQLGLKASEGLKTETSTDIIEILIYIENHSLRELGSLALKPETELEIKKLFKSYFAYHLGVENLNSEGFII